MKLLVIVHLCLSLSLNLFAQEKPEADPKAEQQKSEEYKNHLIAKARFGDKERQQLAKKVSELGTYLKSKVIGQDEAIEALSLKIQQYVDTFGMRKGQPPIALHMMGFTGVGKSLLGSTLGKYLPVVKIDAQSYAGEGSSSSLYWKLADSEIQNKKPVILLIEEIDKVREIVPGRTEEKTSPFIGIFNQILSDGSMSASYGRELDLSHVMVISTMNLPPETIEKFAKRRFLKKQKSFHDFTLKDFERFKDWLVKEKGSMAKVLSDLFRPNTVGRIVPNIIMMEHFSEDQYRELIEIFLKNTIDRLTKEGQEGRRLEVSYTSKFVDFLLKYTVSAPTGARQTVAKTNDYVEQLISYAVRFKLDDKGTTLDVPRKINLDFDKSKVKVTVVPQLYDSQQKKLVDQPAGNFNVVFNENTKILEEPAGLTFVPPASVDYTEPRVITKEETKGMRFPVTSSLSAGLADYINSKVFGQEHIASNLEEEMDRYLSSPGTNLREPMSSVYAGFTGTGKSYLIETAAEFLKVPIARVNLQSFSSQSDDATVKLMDTILNEVEKAKAKSKNGKYFLVLDELDKLFEIDPFGNPIDRPIITVVKDLFDRGVASIAVSSSGWSDSATTKKIDVRDAYLFVSMNFHGKIFEFEADPRLTSIEDTMAAWRQLTLSKAYLKKIFERIFRPDTINRLLSQVLIFKPLEEKHYQKVILAQIDKVVQERFYNKKGEDIGKVKLLLDDTYLKYLLDETVIPSEGARFTVQNAKKLMKRDLEGSMSGLPDDLKEEELSIKLKFDANNNIVTGFAIKDGTKTEVPVYSATVFLFFPDPGISGAVSSERILTAAHEFGHAYTGVRLGLRFHNIVLIPLTPKTAAFVKFKSSGQAAREIIGSIYAAVGSRAMERIMMSNDPRSTDSLLEITAGASSDIQNATIKLYQFAYTLGLDPAGGVIDSQAGFPQRYLNFESVPYSTVQKLGQVMIEMENYLVDELLKANSIDWYRQQILKVARAGVMSEQDFYQAISYVYPGANDEYVSSSQKILKGFGNAVNFDPNSPISKARVFQQGLTKTTAEENLDDYVDQFNYLLKTYLHK